MTIRVIGKALGPRATVYRTRKGEFFLEPSTLATGRWYLMEYRRGGFHSFQTFRSRRDALLRLEHILST